MKRIFNIVIVVVGVVALFFMPKLVSKASADVAVESTKETESAILEDNSVESVVEKESFTYRLYVDKLDMYSYNMLNHILKLQILKSFWPLIKHCLNCLYII